MVKKSARRTRRTHSPAFKAQAALAVHADLEVSHSADNPVSDLERSDSQAGCAFKSNLTGSLEGRHMLHQWLNPALAPTIFGLE